ncbi:hypothetical protein LJR129_004165 [Acidovorax sp. LjRoot129]|uniref:hypothetical protein n=1 Tax=Acidovorax sp. LjRoot129 TaxID=3342260 RepID=UPI003ECEE091
MSALFLWFFQKFLRSEQPLNAPMTARGWLLTLTAFARMGTLGHKQAVATFVWLTASGWLPTLNGDGSSGGCAPGAAVIWPCGLPSPARRHFFLVKSSVRHYPVAQITEEAMWWCLAALLIQ